MACGWQNSCRPWSCNYLQNAGATTYKNFLQFYAKKACKKQFEKAFFDDAELLVLPGGMPGTLHLKEHKGLADLLCKFNEKGKRIAAICAAPTVFGALGLLKEKAACCYPGMEEQLNCKEAKFCSFVTDGNITTSRGVGTAIPFALELIRQLFGNEKASEIAESIVYKE
ncbi:MAG: DJ-1/PfpI family protein [Mediterraneibacter faecis]|nr:DJ-1/PfpI family protein [Mediterraneibacter faecis]MCI7723095.1 DJ-1/PfpI family protein [Mediterraneibacter faecis]